MIDVEIKTNLEVGQKIYYLERNVVNAGIVKSVLVKIEGSHTYKRVSVNNDGFYFENTSISDKLFITKEEALQKLINDAMESIKNL
jgi:hypothetical protein